MKTLLRLEAYKILRCRSMLTMLFAVVVLTLLISGMNRPQYGPESKRLLALEQLNHDFGVSFTSVTDLSKWYAQYLQSPEWKFQAFMSDAGSTWVISLFFAIYFVCRNFEDRTVNAPVYAGKTRLGLFASLLLVYYLTAIIFFAASFLSVQFLTGGGWPAGLPPQYVWSRIGLRLLLNIGSLSLPLMLAFVLKSYARTSGAIFVVLFLIVIAVQKTAGENTFVHVLMENCEPIYLIHYLSSRVGINAVVLTTGRLIQCIVVPIAYIAVTAAVSWLSFRHAELK